MFQREDHLTEIQKVKEDLGNRREVMDKEEECSVISLLKEKAKKLKIGK